jgi:hypothetical protein
VPPHRNILEDTLHAFIQSQTQITQELKNSIDRIVSYLDESENENFPTEPLPSLRTQCGDNEIENPEVDDDKPNNVEEDKNVHILNLVETLDSCLTNSCDFNFSEDCTHELEVNT